MIDLTTLAFIKKYCKQTQQSADTKIDSIQKQVDALVNGMAIVGESTADPLVDGATVSGVKSYKKGNVVLYNSCEYVLVGNTNTKDNWIKLGDDDSSTFKKLSSDSNIWELSGQYILESDVNISLQTGSSVLVAKGSQLSVQLNEKIHYFVLDTTGKIYYGTVELDGTPEENGNALIDLSKTISTDNHVEYKVEEDYNPAHKKYVDDSVESGISDLYCNTNKNLQEDTTKTIIEIQNKSGATSTIVEVDNLDIPSGIAQHEVLGAVKGKDIEDRLIAVEKNPLSVIELSSDVSEDDMKAHNLPELPLDKEQVQKILDSDVTILKVKFNVQKTSGTEIDTLVFYTTVDSVETSNDGGVTAKTIKINAVRTNDEGTIVYHVELLGNGEQFAPTTNLIPTYASYNVSKG